MQSTSSIAINNLTALSFACILSLASYGLGARVMRLFSLGRHSRLEWVVFSTTIGLGILAYAMLTLGLLGLLYQSVTYMLVATSILAGREELVAAVRSVISYLGDGNRLVVRLRQHHKPVLSARRYAAVALGATLLVHLAMNSIVALAPPVSEDALGYHLAAVKVYAQSHRISFIPILNWTFPLTPQMLYMLAMMLWSDRLAVLLSVVMGTVCGLGVFAFGRRHLRLGLTGALIACALFYTTPLTTQSITTAQEDAGFALFTLMAVYSMANWLDTKEQGWIIVSGLTAGWAMGSKYYALLLPPYLVVYALLWFSRRQALREALPVLATFVVVAAAVASPWYVRNWVATGSPIWTRLPVSEFMVSVFGANGLAKGPLALILGPWTYTVGEFRGPLVPLSPLFLAFTPGLLIVWQRDPSYRRVVGLLLGYVALFYLGWFATSSNVTYLSAVIALMALLTAYVMRELSLNGQRWLIVVAFAVILNQLMCLARGALYAVQSLPVVVGAESEERFLQRHAPYQEVWEYVNHNLAQDSRLLVFPRHTYYLERGYFRASFGVQDTIDYLELDSASLLLARLGELGFTHVVWDERYGHRSDQRLATVTGEARQVERQLSSLEASGSLVIIFHQAVEMPISRSRGISEDLEVIIYELR